MTLKMLLIFLFMGSIYPIILSVRVHTQLGHYWDIIPNNCGLSIVPKNTPQKCCGKCFKWQRSIEDILVDGKVFDQKFPVNGDNTRIFGGEKAVKGEAPWDALVRMHLKNYPDKRRGTCGGVILNHRWILTGKDCLPHNKAEIYVGSVEKSQGKNYSAIEVFKLNETNACPMALIKVNEDIEFTIENNRYLVNSICLPQKSLINENSENATLFGWGRASSISNITNSFLMKGVFPVEKCQSEQPCYCSYTSKSENPPLPCKGDSGSGLVQYLSQYNNRAVLIGVLAKAQGSLSGSTCYDIHTYFSAVSTKIDWILDTMKNNQ